MHAIIFLEHFYCKYVLVMKIRLQLVEVPTEEILFTSGTKPQARTNNQVKEDFNHTIRGMTLAD